MLIIVCIPAKSRKKAATAALVMRWSCRKEEKPTSIQWGDNNRSHHDFYTSSCCATQHWSWREGQPAVNHRRHSRCASWEGLGQGTSPPTPSKCLLQRFRIILTSAGLSKFQGTQVRKCPYEQQLSFLSVLDFVSIRTSFVTVCFERKTMFQTPVCHVFYSATL